ncbi:MAG: pseudaminic acid cytidylyltransferase [Lachnospiraceae bacterium]|nr:pseudaminic acid cytidylyltransferase [Lachnospiraceae bacterium]
MKRLAIITARGGSKRIPRKNILPFLGQPILAYSIKAALESGMFDEVMVSTEDDEIATIAKEYGASIPFMRSKETSNDFAGTADVLLEVLSEYKKIGMEFDTMCCIYPTAPFVTKEKLKEAINMLEDSDAETLIPVVRFSYPPQRALVCEDNRLKFKYPEFINSRSQDLEPHFHDAGQFYLVKVDKFIKNKELMVGNIIPYEQSELEVQDIDNMSDWKIAEIKYQSMIDSRKEKE